MRDFLFLIDGKFKRQVSMGAFVCAFALCSLFLCPQQVCAQGDNVDAARESYSKGQRFFDNQEFVKALTAFRASFDAFPHFRTIFSIALCFEKLNRYSDAIDAYERYLAWSDSVPQQAEVKQKIAQLKEKLPPEQATESLPEDEAVITQDSTDQDTALVEGDESKEDDSAAMKTDLDTDGKRKLRVPGWILMGSGIVFAGTSGVMFGLANGKQKDLEQLDGELYNADKLEETRADGRRFEIMGWVFGGTGIACIATGLVLLIASSPGEKEKASADVDSRVRFNLGVASSRAELGLSWSF